MSDKATQPIEISANLFNDLVKFLDEVESNKPVRQMALLQDMQYSLASDICMEDGYGHCDTHDDTVDFWVNNFGPKGVILVNGHYAPDVDEDAGETCFPVCPGSQDYNRKWTRAVV